MRSLILVTILCLTSTAAFACVFDNDCKPGSVCMDGVCSGNLNAGSNDDNAPTKRATGKSCFDDGDCSEGSRCIKGSGLEGVCIGH
jgi:hypothetical protein